MNKDFLDELDTELSGLTNNSGVSSDNNENKSQPPIIQKENKNNTQQNFQNDNQVFLKNNTILNFPEVKFYLPKLRDKYTRFIPIGGNNETGAKNMNMFQYGEEILLLDCGVQFAEPEMLGANYSIPDISFLIPYKENIKGLVITHAHLDHIGALKNILPSLGFPTVYATKLTVGIIKKGLEEARILSQCTLIVVDSDNGEFIKIGNSFNCEFFRVNHSVPDCAGVYIETPGGCKIAHTGDFKIDFAPEIDKPADLGKIGEIGARGVTLFLSDSTASTRKGFSTSEKEIGRNLEQIITHHNSGRLIITIFSSWISRVQQIINSCEMNDKYLFLSGRSMLENINIAKELGYLKVKPGRIKKMTPKATEGIPLEKQVIVTTGSQGEEFSALSRMAEGRHNSIEIMEGDTIVFSSSIVPGNERSVVGVINKLIRLGANVITKDDREVHTGGHAFQEEQKIMLNLVKPKYFCPVFGDLFFRDAHRKTAMTIGIKDENILMLDNGNIVDFGPDGRVFRSKIKVPIQDLIIDGHGIGTANSHVIQAREKMMNSGVLVITYKVDSKTKAILGTIKVETRGLVYLEEVRTVHKMIIKKSKFIYENTVKDVPEIEEKDLVKIIKNDLEGYLSHKIDRSPMIIPIVIEV